MSSHKTLFWNSKIQTKCKNVAGEALSYLCTGGSYSSAGHFDIKTTFRVLLSPKTGVIWRFSRPLPVTDGLSNGLENTTKKMKKEKVIVQ